MERQTLERQTLERQTLERQASKKAEKRAVTWAEAPSERRHLKAPEPKLLLPAYRRHSVLLRDSLRLRYSLSPWLGSVPNAPGAPPA